MYKVLKNQTPQMDGYSLVPIRLEDRFKIMRWRNEQIYHLRQSEPLTEAKQDAYFEDVVAEIFTQKQPNQLLFSFLNNTECIGYGGLVHINWEDKNAEVSFIMKTDLEKQYFQNNWQVFLLLIEKIAFEELSFHKIFTYAFDIRPHLYPALEGAGFKKEAVLPEHCLFEGKFSDVIIHSKLNRKIVLKEASIEDAEITFQWANNPKVRQFAITQNKITKSEHFRWFEGKIDSSKCLYFIASYNQVIIGSFRLDLNENKIGVISYLLDPNYHSMGLGKSILVEGVKKAKAYNELEKVVGYVMEENHASIHLFKKLNFTAKCEEEGLLKFELDVK